MKKLNLYKDFISKYEPFNINEGLIKSISPAIVIDKLPMLLRAKNINFKILCNTSGQIYIELFDIDNNGINFLFSLIGNFGYFVSRIILNDIEKKFDKDEIDLLLHLYNKIDITIFIEAYYDVEIKNISNFIYHATSTSFVENILKNGFLKLMN